MSATKMPLKDYIPKDITQQAKLLEKYPEYDGRGLTIAIIDTGIDVGFDGMQKTTTGLPKIIDCFDFTDSAIVNTSIIKETYDSDNNVIGLSGRLLKIPSKWKNPSEKWHLGLKSVYELCSDSVLKSIIETRKETIAQNNEKLKQEIEAKRDENYESFMEYLKMTEELSKDSLVVDCIVWFNGEKWQACIDTSFIGDLEDAKVLSNFNDEHEYSNLCDILNYCIKVHNHGNLLEIFAAFDYHGTVVAQVAAACFPDKPERNGLAPGAQIISMTVSDSKNKNVENGPALIKALQKCAEMNVDIVNCSFGGPNKELEAQINELTEKHGILFFHCAGNYGPVYCSVNRFCSLFPNVFFIGSVSTKNMQNEISYQIPYYSSRGPDFLGGRGVDFVAPDNVTVPSSDKTLTLHGTSYAAPNAAGAIACLITALKSNSIKYSPSTIKFALSKTTLLPSNGNVLAYGHGIIQIYDAFEFVRSSEFWRIYSNGNCRVKLLNEESNGILFKLKAKEGIKNYSVEIVNNSNMDNITLKMTDGAEKFIQCSPIQNNIFTIQLDTNYFKNGTINYAEIYGINSTLETIFYFPVTVIAPQIITCSKNYSIRRNFALKNGIPQRFFILPPTGSQQCIVTITAVEEILTYLLLSYAVENHQVRRGNKKILKFDAFTKVLTDCLTIDGNSIHEFSLMLATEMDYRFLKFIIEIEFFGITLKSRNCAKNEENSLIFSNAFENLSASLSLQFSILSYTLIPVNICCDSPTNNHGSDIPETLKLTYTFTSLL